MKCGCVLLSFRKRLKLFDAFLGKRDKIRVVSVFVEGSGVERAGFAQSETAVVPKRETMQDFARRITPGLGAQVLDFHNDYGARRGLEEPCGAIEDGKLSTFGVQLDEIHVRNSASPEDIVKFLNGNADCARGFRNPGRA